MSTQLTNHVHRWTTDLATNRMEQPCAECGKTWDEYVSERAARSAKPATQPISGGHLSAGDPVQIPVAARSILHCDWCAEVEEWLRWQREWKS